jgi:exopolysaccharide transport family protein
MEKQPDKQDKLVRADQNFTPLQGYNYPPPNALAYMQGRQEEDQVHVLDYLRVLVKRRWIILTFTCVVLVVTAIATWTATPIYRATIKLEIDPEQTNVLPFKDAIDPGSTYAQSQEYLQTQFKVLESETLAARVVRALNLDTDPRFLTQARPTVQSKTLEWLRGIFGLSEKIDTKVDPGSLEERRLESLARYFRASLTTTPIRNSRLVDVSFDARDPKLAAEAANTLATEYIQMNFETKFNATTTASDFLARQLVDLKAKVEKSEEELVRFSQQHDIYTLGDKENVILQKLSDLNTALTTAQADRIQKESVWNIVQQAGPGNFPDTLRNPSIQGLETNVATLMVQHARLSALFKPGWPELDQVTGQVTEAEKQLAFEKQRAIKNADTEYRTALQREKLLAQALSAQKVEASTLNQNSIQYNILKRQVESDKQLYEGLLQRMKEAGVSAGLKSNNIHVVDPAQAPRSPYKPNKPLNLSLAMVIGLLLGLGLAFFIEFLDSSIKTPDDVDRFIKLPSLGVIPSVSSLPPASHHKMLPALTGNGNGGNGTLPEKSVEMITYYDVKSLISEAYRNLRTSILLSSSSGYRQKVLLVTSSIANEGKTTSAINIAITLSQTGDRVVLLDCDMRNPRLHRILDIKNSAGMSTFLSGNSDLSSLIQQSPIPNLFVVPAGRIPPNPAELVGSPRMKQGLTLLEEHFDHIVIDSPPVLSVADARILGAIADGVVLVIKGGETSKQAVQRTKRLLLEVNAHLIGTLLNSVDVHSADYYYYSKYYAYGYGKKYGYGAKPAQQEKDSEDT